MNFFEYYGLKEDPFKVTPDPGYFFPSSNHEEAYNSLEYAVEKKEGFCLITGEPGTGKTTVLKVFIEKWKEKAKIALILTPRLSPEEFLLCLLDDLNVKCAKKNKADLLKAFRDFLLKKHKGECPVIIIVDEAQNLPDETLEELRLLSNLETDKDKLLQVFLAGQPELKQKLSQENLRQLNQRISVRAVLPPLTPDELHAYLNYRMVKAGKGILQLDKKLAKRIHASSRGIPRIVNLIISRSIMSAYVEGSHMVTSKHVQYALSHLKGGELTASRHSYMTTIYGCFIFATLMFFVWISLK